MHNSGALRRGNAKLHLKNWLFGARQQSGPLACHASPL